MKNCVWLGVCLLLIAGCSPGMKKYLSGGPFDCVEKISEDALDDLEIYSTTKCGRTFDRSTGELHPYPRLIKKRNQPAFYIEMIALLPVIQDAPYESLRFLIDDERVEFSIKPYHKFKNAWLYIIPLPWKYFKSIKGNLKLRFYGKFQRTYVLQKRFVFPLQQFVTHKKLEEMTEPPKNSPPPPSRSMT